MADYDDKNRGSIWKNEKKTTDKHPDFTGSLNVDGKDYWVSAWRRKEGASDRAPALSFSVKPKDGKPMDAPRPATGGGMGLDMDDTIPFGPEFR
jgi:hypothetical protein